MNTEILSTSGAEGQQPLKAAVELLRKGEIVSLPTETVYGLAADALDPIAVARIFDAKGRPHFDPLIVHLPDRGWLERVADIPAKDRQLILELAEAYWPGPFTMVVPKRNIVPEIVTAGLDTVAVRMSAHSVFADVISELGNPLAAPSANRFGRISPTTAKHVLEELGGLIPLIIDAGPTIHGIESTIARISNGRIEVLRRGPITSEELSRFGPVGVVNETEKISAPGQLKSHYAPKTPLRLVEDLNSFDPRAQRCALLAWNPVKSDTRFAAVRNLSEQQDLPEAAANLFRYLRELDALNVDLIVAERVPDQGLGAAILDRLRRASQA
ncbi:MAG TPA: L-threonylcarbamoyladenylate synthase [Chthoniobacterales bacterium]|nr:L-threonylcarbamoyladenylate synthase [Chthoniobacterales bacterium]